MQTLNKTFLSFGLFFITLYLTAQTPIKLMSYNLLHYPTGTGIDRKDNLKYILDTYQPDIFMACEIENGTGADEILNYCLGTQKFASSSFTYNHSGSQYPLQQMLYYNKFKFELVNETYLTTYVRDINHYTLKLLTDNTSDNIYIEVYVAHLKAGADSTNSSNNDTSNENARRDMVQVFVDDLANIPSDHFVIFAGDFNLYTYQEPAYQKIIDPNNAIVMKDPIHREGPWHNNIQYKDIFTQSTHSTSANSYVGGGLDDRFDFIMMSQNLLNNPVLHYTSNTYKSFGNNGTCFNKAINSSYCSGNLYDDTLRENLYTMSDHLPVVASLQTTATLSVNKENLLVTRINEGTYVQSTLSLHSDGTLPMNVQIFNSLGQRLLSVLSYQPDMPINISTLSQGIYFLHLQSGQKQQVIKFVKIP